MLQITGRPHGSPAANRQTLAGRMPPPRRHAFAVGERYTCIVPRTGGKLMVPSISDVRGEGAQ
jgi:hypothetical protein